MRLKNIVNYFSRTEIVLWCCSVALIVLSFCIFDRESYLTLISFSFSYYGEMITYIGMTMPMAVFALISWLKNPYSGNKSEVKVNNIGNNEIVLMWVLTAVVTFVFYIGQL